MNKQERDKLREMTLAGVEDSLHWYVRPEIVLALLDRIDELEGMTPTERAVHTHWAHSNPGLADQYRAEAKACRRALGFDEDSETVSPKDLLDAIKAMLAAAPGAGGDV